MWINVQKIADTGENNVHRRYDYSFVRSPRSRRLHLRVVSIYEVSFAFTLSRGKNVVDVDSDSYQCSEYSGKDDQENACSGILT